MNFKNIAEAFNHYKNFSNEQLEKRAQEIKGIIETDPNVDINSLNIELTALKEAKENNNEKSEGETRSQFLNVVDSFKSVEILDAENVLGSENYRNAFLKTMLGRSLNNAETRAFNCVMEKRDNAFNYSANSSYILPTKTLNEILTYARNEGGLFAECRLFNVPSKILIPVCSSEDVAIWHQEGAEVETKQAFTNAVTFDGWELIKIMSISKKIEKMTVEAFESYLVEELTASIMDAISSSIVSGTGTTQPSGLNSINWMDEVNQVTAPATDGYNAFTSFVSLLKRGYAKGSKIALNNKTLYKRVYGCVDKNGRPIFIADPKGEAVGRILGFEVIVDDYIADDVLYCGNFKKYYGVNIADGVTVEKSTESSFTKNLIDFKATAIVDAKPLISEAFVKLVLTETV